LLAAPSAQTTRAFHQVHLDQIQPQAAARCVPLHRREPTVIAGRRGDDRAWGRLVALRGGRARGETLGSVDDARQRKSRARFWLEQWRAAEQTHEHGGKARYASAVSLGTGADYLRRRHGDFR
jgi:hypothetical protein